MCASESEIHSSTRASEEHMRTLLANDLGTEHKGHNHVEQVVRERSSKSIDFHMRHLYVKIKSLTLNKVQM